MEFLQCSCLSGGAYRSPAAPQPRQRSQAGSRQQWRLRGRPLGCRDI